MRQLLLSFCIFFIPSVRPSGITYQTQDLVVGDFLMCKMTFLRAKSTPERFRYYILKAQKDLLDVKMRNASGIIIMLAKFCLGIKFSLWMSQLTANIPINRYNFQSPWRPH